MCYSKMKLHHDTTTAFINGRRVLQQTGNQIANPDHRRIMKEKSPAPPPPPALQTSPKIRSPRPPSIRKEDDAVPLTTPRLGKVSTPERVHKSMNTSKKPKVSSTVRTLVPSSGMAEASGAAGSIAAARKEQVAILQEQRKMKIAHYGRVSSSSKCDRKVHPLEPSAAATATTATAVDPVGREEKRCSFITANSDPIFVTYHDEEWGVPVHDDRLLFELLVLTVAQVGSDWTTVLKKRQLYREAFSEFDPEIVAKFGETKIASINSNYGIELSQIRGVVDNSKRILEVRREYGSFEEYLWGFVNKKPIQTQYRRSQKMPVKSSKSESISKNMVKRGFRYVGPTVIHSFMQAAGLTNDHLVTCPRHQLISLLGH